MSDYTKITNFTAKDALLSGNPSKVVKGTEIDAEFTAIAVAVATKYDTADLGTNVSTFLTTPSSANLLAAITDETGTGVVVFNINPTLQGLTLSGALAGADNTVSRINLLDYGEVTNAIGSIGGGTQDIDLTLGNSVVATVDTSTTTFTFSNPTASDEHCGFVLYLTNGGSQTVNWPASVDWANAAVPTLTVSGLDILAFTTVDGGTTWYGHVIGQAVA